MISYFTGVMDGDREIQIPFCRDRSLRLKGLVFQILFIFYYRSFVKKKIFQYLLLFDTKLGIQLVCSILIY